MSTSRHLSDAVHTLVVIVVVPAVLAAHVVAIAVAIAVGLSLLASAAPSNACKSKVATLSKVSLQILELTCHANIFWKFGS